MPTTGDNNQIGTTVTASIVKIVVTYLLRFLQSSQMLFAIVMFTAMIAMIVIGLQDTFFGGSLLPITSKLPNFLINWLSHGENKTLNNGDILRIFSFLSFIVFLLGLIVRRVFKIKWQWTFGRKLKLACAVLIGGYALIFILAPHFKLSPGTSLGTMYIVLGFFLIFSLFATAYALVVSAVINKVIEIINKSNDPKDPASPPHL